MRLSCESKSSPGPVRKVNEDSFVFWQSEDETERLERGAIAVMADGVGGHGDGEIASKLAMDTAISVFRRINPVNSPKQILKQIFDSANLEVYEAGMAAPRGGRMATTLSVCILRDKELFIGHVGDTRVYLVRRENIRRLTDDHSYTAMQVKLRLISEYEAKASRLRSMLTRSIGADPVVQFDYKHLKLMSRDRIVQCTDGLYCYMNDSELLEGVDRLNMDEICPYLIALSERRGTDDNLTVQVVQVDRLVEPKYDQPISISHRTGAGHSAIMTNEVKAGDVLDDRFEIEGVISRSGMASIYKAKDHQTGNTVAVKIPYMQLESDPAAFARFQREAEIGETLNHPNILKYIKVPNKSRQYIVMEYLEGRTLSTILSEMRPLPIPDAVQIASYICGAVAHMHAHQVIHRDLKPQNIMICDDGTLRIIDFGIAKSSQLRRLTFTGFTPAMGTPDYMAPEQVKGKRGDERTDIYSIGAVLYEMTTGSVPFEGPNPFIVMNSRLTGDPVAPRKLNPQISEALEEVILHAMEREPHRRYQSAEAMKRELDDPESVKTTGRHRQLKAPKAWKARWQGARLVVISAVAPILVFLAALFFTHCHGAGH
jgi:serine/threonine protein phosphatase PrpC/predicted Ser/Thr protein kinase